MNHKEKIKHYAEAVSMWNARFDTAEIAAQLGVKECLVARWIANYRDIMVAL